MKHCPLIVLLASVVLLSCTRLPKPQFSWYPELELEAGDSIYFFNESKRADELLWEFGDGSESGDEAPVHAYDSSGVYELSLHAMNSEGTNIANEYLAIYEATILGFLVRDSTGDILLEGARVRVFESRLDRELEAEAAYEGRTGRDGMVEFRNLEPAVYYVRVEMDLDHGRWSALGSTNTLAQHKKNFYTVNCSWDLP